MEDEELKFVMSGWGSMGLKVLSSGHSKIDTTMIYAHTDESMVKYEHEKSVI